MGYLAFQEHKNLLSMGLHRLDLDDWLVPDDGLADQVNLKQALWRDKGERVFSALPSSVAAQREVTRLMADHLSRRFPTLYQTTADGLYCTATGQTQSWHAARHPLLPLSWCVQEDLCLLEPDDGDYRLTAASLCAPSYWNLLDKVGHTLDAVHGPVPGYEEQLSHKVNRFFERIKVDRPVWRGNWSVVTSDRLYQPGGEESEPIVDPDAIPERCHIRTERQTLRRLPETSAVLFTIRVAIRPLSDYLKQPQVLNDLLDTLSGMSEAERSYKSLHLLEPALSDWLSVQSRASASRD